MPDQATTVQRSFFDVLTATIASGASLSDALDLGGTMVTGIIMPSAWTAANLTFQVSMNGGSNDFQNLYDDSTEVTVTAAASRNIRLNGDLWRNFRYLKIRSGTSGAAVNQGASRSVLVVVRPWH